MKADDVTLVVGLGKACQTAYQIRRLALTTEPLLPFDNAASPFGTLITTLYEDFNNLFQHTAGVLDHDHNFVLGHQPIAQEVLDSWQRRVTRFRDLVESDERIMFVRGWRAWNDDEQEDEDLLHQALTQYGFKHFLLRYIEMDPYVQGQGNSWQGNDARWEHELDDVVKAVAKHKRGR